MAVLTNSFGGRYFLRNSYFVPLTVDKLHMIDVASPSDIGFLTLQFSSDLILNIERTLLFRSDLRWILRSWLLLVSLVTVVELS